MTAQPMPLINKIAFSLWGVIAACVAVWALVMYLPDDAPTYLAVASEGQTELRLNEVTCVSIDSRRVVYDTKKYIDSKLPEAITDVLAIKNVFLDADAAICPWSFDITGIPGMNFNVAYGQKFTHYVVSVAICERTSDEPTNSDKCRSKEIYIFNRQVEPHKQFLLALVGLARVQTTEWDVFEVSKETL